MNCNGSSGWLACIGMRASRCWELRWTKLHRRRAQSLHPSARGKRLLALSPRPTRGILVEGLSALSAEECRLLIEALAPLQQRLANLGHPSDGTRPLD